MIEAASPPRRSAVILRGCPLRDFEPVVEELQYQPLWPPKKKSSSLGPPLLTSFSASCSSKVKNGSLLSGSVCADAPDVLPAPGVACCSYDVVMLNLGSRFNTLLSCSGLRFAVRGTGDGAKLASCGNGENVKFGENGRLSPLPFVFGPFPELFGSGGE